VTADLAAKLRQWNVAGRSTAPPPRATHGVEAVVPGRFETTAYGECFLVERRYPLALAQGAFPLAEALALSPRARRLLARGAPAEAIEPGRALFLDTETTGLAGGTGTYAFLVGLGYFDGAEFCLRQYFMRHPGEEAALLAAVSELLASFPLWVSFNGKAFDVPLLETRFLYSRRAPLRRPEYHLDLLHPARRLWRSRLPTCALASLEHALLGVRRQDDVPSWAIPALYFDYVRRGRCEPLRAVFAHNADDLLSLVALLALVGRVLEEPQRHAPHVDALALLRLYAEGGCAGEAAAWCAQALDQVAASQRGALRWELAAVLRRAGDRAAAARLWLELAAEAGPWAIAAQVELAKHYEYQQRDYRAAIRAVEAALAAIAVSRGPGAAAERMRLERRLGRLHFRAHRSAGDRGPRSQPSRLVRDGGEPAAAAPGRAGP
jgi:uncharacterized protein YprB with RNaseH-like and TPR domain